MVCLGRLNYFFKLSSTHFTSPSLEYLDPCIPSSLPTANIAWKHSLNPYNTEVYIDPSQTSKMDIFVSTFYGSTLRFQVVTYFRINFHSRGLTGFWIRLCNSIIIKPTWTNHGHFLLFCIHSDVTFCGPR